MRSVTVGSLIIAGLGLASGIASAQTVGTMGGLAQPVCVSLGVLIGLTFVPMDTMQETIINRMGGNTNNED